MVGFKRFKQKFKRRKRGRLVTGLSVPLITDNGLEGALRKKFPTR